MVKKGVIMLDEILKDKTNLDKKTHFQSHEIKESSLGFYMHMISKYCEQHPTCDNCAFCQNHWGCYFRNKLPREWSLRKGN